MSETLTCICDQGFGMNLSCPVHQLPAATVLLSGPSAEDERRPVDWEQFTTSERVAFVRGWRAALASRTPAGEPGGLTFAPMAAMQFLRECATNMPLCDERTAYVAALVAVENALAPDGRAPSEDNPSHLQRRVGDLEARDFQRVNDPRAGDRRTP